MPRTSLVVLLCLFAVGGRQLSAQDAPVQDVTPDTPARTDTRKKADTRKGKHSDTRKGDTNKDGTSGPKQSTVEMSGSSPQTAPPSAEPPKPESGPGSNRIVNTAKNPPQIISFPQPPPTGDSGSSLSYLVLVFCMMSIAVLGFAATKLTARRWLDGNFEPLSHQVNAAVKQATSARSRYVDLSSRLAETGKRRPPTPPPLPPPPPPPTRLTPSYPQQPTTESARPPQPGPPATRRAPQPEVSTPQAKPAFPTAVSSDPVQPVRKGDEVVEAYNRVRSSVSSASARDDFERLYPFERATCTNHEDWRIDKTAVLRFQRDSFGWFLVLRRGGEYQAFPWFSYDLAQERESFAGVFQYPEASGTAALRVATPATLKCQGDDWMQTASGSLEVDG